MLFVVMCTDKAGHEHVRMENRPAHLAFLKEYGDHLFAAGPLQTDDGEHMIGSVLIMDFEDRAAVEAFAARDPYKSAGLFESVVIHRWKKVLPADAAA